MLYVGHFDFLENNDDNCTQYRHFTCVAEADSIETALEKLKRLLLDLRERDDILDGIDEVFLDTCVQISSIPDQGFLAHYVAVLGEYRGKISTSIRGATDDQCIAYSYEVPEEDGEHTVEPFVVFEGD